MFKASVTITSPFNKVPYWWRTRNHIGEGTSSSLFFQIGSSFQLGAFYYKPPSHVCGFILPCTLPSLPPTLILFYTTMALGLISLTSYYHSSHPKYFMSECSLFPPQAILPCAILPSPMHLCLVMTLDCSRIYPVQLLIIRSSFNTQTGTLGLSQSGIT